MQHITDFKNYGQEKVNEVFGLFSSFPKQEKKDAIKLIEELELIIRFSMKSKEVFSKLVDFFTSISFFNDKYLSEIQKRKGYDWEILHKTLKRAGRSDYGMNRTQKGEQPNDSNIYLTTPDRESCMTIDKFHSFYDQEGNFKDFLKREEYDVKPMVKKFIQSYLDSEGDMNLITVLKKCYKV